MATAPTDDDADAFVAAFLARRIADRQAGREGSLEDYCRLFPGREAIVRSAWSASGQDDAADAGDAGERGIGAIEAGGRFGHYRLVRRLGRGGQGEVWLAEDPRLRRQVAIKLLRGLAFTTVDALRRFRREAEVASRLDHPGICPVYDVGTEHGMPYLVMRFVDGRPLGEAIAAATPRLATPQHVAWTIRVVGLLAEALQAAHEAGVLHRDLKPQNVVLTRDDRPVLLDFGLARLVEDEAMFTRTGELRGTPAYVAPELLASPTTRPDAGADVYGLGLVLYECLTHGRPFDAPTLDGIYRQILSGTPVPVRQRNPAVPRDLEVILQTAMQRDPRRRYASAQALAEDLRRFAARQPILARRAGPLLRLRLWFQRSPGLATAVAVLVLTLAVGLTTSLVLWRQAREGQSRAAGMLAEWERLADRRRLDQLREEADTALWPAVAEKIPAMDAWLLRAEALVQHLAAHRRALDEIGRTPAGQADPAFDDDETAWRYQQLRELVRQLEEFARDDVFATTLAAVARRRAMAVELQQQTIVGAAAAWTEAAARVHSAAPYGGLVLSPQFGLVPLGPDPRTHLEEFALPATGDVPRRDEAGRLAIGESTGIVLVLLPGGAVWVGAQARDPAAPNHDPQARPLEGPVHRVQLEPFLLSKFEVTQGQWLRTTGANPSTTRPGTELRGHTVDLRHPVESATWDECETLVRRLGLALPSEAQWEYACRAGGNGPWSTGAVVASLAGHANLGDEASRGGYPRDWRFEPGFDDGYAMHSPVGVLLPNALGLHDMHGNVREWCAGAMTRYQADGPGDPRRKVYRGGSYEAPAAFARSAYREAEQAEARVPFVGLRPARRLD